MNNKDILIGIYRDSLEVNMRLCHRPTGITVNGKGKSQYKLQKKLLKELLKLVNKRKESNE